LLNTYEGNFWNLSTKSGYQSKAEQLQWRRAKVVEMKARGLSQIEIARQLHVSDASIGSDVQYLRQQAKETIKEYATDHLPEQYHICLVALDSIIKRASDIIETANDNREKLQAMQMYRDTHQLKLELLSNATTIDSALQFIRSKQQAQQQQFSHAVTKLDDCSDSHITADTMTTAAGKQSVF
jgi:hypothetical protein